MNERTDRVLYPGNTLDRLQELEQRVATLERLAGRPGQGAGQLAHYDEAGRLWLGPGMPYEPAELAWMGAVGMLQMMPGLVGLWPGGGIGDGSTLGYATDISGNGLHLKRALGARIGAIMDDYPLAASMFFNGSTAYFSHADHALFDIVGTEGSVMQVRRGLAIGGWFYFERDATVETLLAKWGSGTNTDNSYMLSKGDDDVIRLYVSDSTPANIGVGLGTVTTSQWYFCAGRYTPGEELAVWLNGDTNAVTTGIPASINSGTQAFSIGARNVNSTVLNYFHGYASLCFLCAAAVPDAMIEAFYERTRVLFGA